MYIYEKIPIETNKIYFDKIDIIENLKEFLKIKENDISSIITEDIFNSTKIEGNILTAKEVTYYLENDITVRGKPLRYYKQIDNYKNALNSMKQWVKSEDFVLSEDFILTVHQMITNKELPISESGVYRDDAVHINTTLYIPPSALDVPECMKELINEYNKPIELGETRFERICEFKRNFERIHPFFDGNGRTGRVLMNTLFLKNGYSFITIPFNERDLYFESLENNTFHKYALGKMYNQMLKIKEHHRNKEFKYIEDDDFER